MTVFSSHVGRITRPIWTVLGSCWRIDSSNALPNNQQGRSTIPAKHFFSKTLLLPGWELRKCPWTGLCWPTLGLCWGYVGPSGVYVGARFAHLGAMLGLCWPPGGDFGAMSCSWVHLHSQILLEKALPSGLRGTHSIFATPFLWKSWILLGRAHPWWAPEGSHQWPVGFQKTRPEGRKRGRGSGSVPL